MVHLLNDKYHGSIILLTSYILNQFPPHRCDGENFLERVMIFTEIAIAPGAVSIYLETNAIANQPEWRQIRFSD